jgi:hypothetical protein
MLSVAKICCHGQLAETDLRVIYISLSSHTTILNLKRVRPYYPLSLSLSIQQDSGDNSFHNI